MAISLEDSKRAKLKELGFMGTLLGAEVLLAAFTNVVGAACQAVVVAG